MVTSSSIDENLGWSKRIERIPPLQSASQWDKCARFPAGSPKVREDCSGRAGIPTTTINSASWLNALQGTKKGLGLAGLWDRCNIMSTCGLYHAWSRTAIRRFPEAFRSSAAHEFRFSHSSTT